MTRTRTKPRVTVVVGLHGGVFRNVSVYRDSMDAGMHVFDVLEGDRKLAEQAAGDTQHFPKTSPKVNLNQFWKEYDAYLNRLYEGDPDDEVRVFEREVD